MRATSGSQQRQLPLGGKTRHPSPDRGNTRERNAPRRPRTRSTPGPPRLPALSGGNRDGGGPGSPKVAPSPPCSPQGREPRGHAPSRGALPDGGAARAASRPPPPSRPPLSAAQRLPTCAPRPAAPARCRRRLGSCGGRAALGAGPQARRRRCRRRCRRSRRGGEEGPAAWREGKGEASGLAGRRAEAGGRAGPAGRLLSRPCSHSAPRHHLGRTRCQRGAGSEDWRRAGGGGKADSPRPGVQRGRKDEAAAPRHAPYCTIEFAGGFPSDSFTRGSRRKGARATLACVRRRPPCWKRAKLERRERGGVSRLSRARNRMCACACASAAQRVLPVGEVRACGVSACTRLHVDGCAGTSACGTHISSTWVFGATRTVYVCY